MKVSPGSTSTWMMSAGLRRSTGVFTRSRTTVPSSRLISTEVRGYVWKARRAVILKDSNCRPSIIRPTAALIASIWDVTRWASARFATPQMRVTRSRTASGAGLQASASSPWREGASSSSPGQYTPCFTFFLRRSVHELTPRRPLGYQEYKDLRSVHPGTGVADGRGKELTDGGRTHELHETLAGNHPGNPDGPDPRSHSRPGRGHHEGGRRHQASRNRRQEDWRRQDRRGGRGNREGHRKHGGGRRQVHRREAQGSGKGREASR